MSIRELEQGAVESAIRQINNLVDDGRYEEAFGLAEHWYSRRREALLASAARAVAVVAMWKVNSIRIRSGNDLSIMEEPSAAEKAVAGLSDETLETLVKHALAGREALAEVERLKKGVADAQSEHERLTRSVLAAQSVCKGLEDEKKDLLNSLATANRELTKLKTAKDNDAEMRKAVERKNMRLDAEMRALRRQLEEHGSASEQIAKLLQENQALETRVKVLEGMVCQDPAPEAPRARRVEMSGYCQESGTGHLRSSTDVCR